MITGMVASAGTAMGKVVVVNGNDVECMRRAREVIRAGDILVTDMAQPSMIDLITKAGAVISNEGGLLSHAAILCREMGIPCIVGTVSATKVLTDGQVVEINERGEVIQHGWGCMAESGPCESRRSNATKKP
jgi:phosphoenolpyruvate synthase/pyruvate phosphate dikinase